jgi:predicted transcriptional regulator
MTHQPRISAAESQIMDVLWRIHEPLSAERVREQLSGAWSEATVRTFLRRLAKKRAVSQTREGKRFLYAPLVDRAEYAHAESRHLIDRLFGGRLTPFVTQFAERETLTPEEVEALRKLIDRFDDGR